MASDFPYLYPHTLTEAKRRGEAQMHKDSFRENVKCAWAIDKAVRDCVREGEAALAEDCIQPILAALPQPEDRPSTLSAWEMGRSCAGTDMISTVCWTINICPTGRQRSWRRFRIPSSNSRRLPPAEWR